MAKGFWTRLRPLFIIASLALVVAVGASPVPASASLLRAFPSAVSCLSTTACTAVGGYVNRSGVGFMSAFRWNGTAWHIQSTPIPAGSTNDQLNAVSCPSTSDCTAVGRLDGSGNGALAEHWNGASWAIEFIPSPGPVDTLAAVSCPSTTACTAVGNYHNSSGTLVALAEHWNGTSWAMQSIPNPARAGIVFMLGVSCPSITSCTAVGSYQNSSLVEVALVERWNGSSWAIQSIPIPAGATGSNLSAVSCPSTTACTAVGGYTNRSGVGVALAWRWNGTRWAIQAPINPAVFSLSCPSTTFCIAVGSYFNRSDVSVAVAQRWDGTRWATESIPVPAGATFLSGVSCLSTTACTAVGGYINGSGVGVGLVERWNGSAWHIQSFP